MSIKVLPTDHSREKVHLSFPKIDYIETYRLYIYVIYNIGKVKCHQKNLMRMNSSSLKENGFAEFYPLKGLSFASLPYNKGSVFVIIDTTLTGKPASDILYIGKSKKPTKRIFGGYLAGFGGRTARRINAKLFDDGYIEKTGISWVLSDTPKVLQRELLDKFMKEHGKSPLWNASTKASEKPKKPQVAAKTAKPRAPRKPSA